MSQSDKHSVGGGLSGQSARCTKLSRLFMEAAAASSRHHVYSAAHLKYEDSPVWRGRGRGRGTRSFPGGLLDCLNIDSNQQLVVQTGGAGL